MSRPRDASQFVALHHLLLIFAIAVPVHAQTALDIDTANDVDIGLRECLDTEPASYREDQFRALVPCTLAGAKVVGTPALQRLAAEPAGAWLVDVMPSPRKPASLGANALWLPLPRDSLPNAVWLPNTGFGVIPVEESAYLRRSLTRLRNEAPVRPLVFFCEANCWMSWNAARRAIEWGYKEVYWYPDGTDGWHSAGYPLAAAEPAAGR